LENAMRYLSKEKFIEADGKEWRFLREPKELELQLKAMSNDHHLF
jgi:hypothetical protein